MAIVQSGAIRFPSRRYVWYVQENHIFRSFNSIYLHNGKTGNKAVYGNYVSDEPVKRVSMVY